jgi:hypothetical protein
MVRIASTRKNERHLLSLMLGPRDWPILAPEGFVGLTGSNVRIYCRGHGAPAPLTVIPRKHNRCPFVLASYSLLKPFESPLEGQSLPT